MRKLGTLILPVASLVICVGIAAAAPTVAGSLKPHPPKGKPPTSHPAPPATKPAPPKPPTTKPVPPKPTTKPTTPPPHHPTTKPVK